MKTNNFENLVEKIMNNETIEHDNKLYELSYEKKTEETKLFYQLKKNSSVLQLVTVKIETVYYSEKNLSDESEESKIKSTSNKTILSCVDISKVENKVKNIPEFLGYYMYFHSLRFTWTALNTIYQKSCDKRILSLMIELIDIWKDNIFNKSDFENYVIAENMTKEYQKKKTVTKEKRVINGKNHFVEIIPYDVLENTETGKELIQIETLQNYDVYDLIQVSNLALIECYQLGLIHSFSDVSNLRKYCYKRINSYIISESKNKNRNGVLFNDSIETESEEYNHSAENTYMNMEKETEENLVFDYIMDVIKNGLSEHARKNQNIKLAVSVWCELMIENESTHETAKRFNIAQTQVMRYKKLVNDYIMENRKMFSDLLDIAI